MYLPMYALAAEASVASHVLLPYQSIPTSMWMSMKQGQASPKMAQVAECGYALGIFFNN
jgi:hypothetical protein